MASSASDPRSLAQTPNSWKVEPPRAPDGTDGDGIMDRTHGFPSGLKPLAVVGVALGLLALWQWSPMRDRLGEPATWREHLVLLGPWAPLGFALANAVLVAIGAPRLVLALLAGVLFGLRVGLPLTWLSSAGGAYATFLFFRWGARDWAEHRLRRRAYPASLLQRPSVWAVVLWRQVPMVAVLQNAVLALTRVTHRVFWAGTLVGTLPSTAVAVWAGSRMADRSWRSALGVVAVAMVVLAVLGAGLGRFASGLLGVRAPVDSRTESR